MWSMQAVHDHQSMHATQQAEPTLQIDFLSCAVEASVYSLCALCLAIILSALVTLVIQHCNIAHHHLCLLSMLQALSLRSAGSG